MHASTVRICMYMGGCACMHPCMCLHVCIYGTQLTRYLYVGVHVYVCICMCTGDVNSGKSVLVDKICQASKTKNLTPGHHLSGCCLEYRYFDVRDEETDGEPGMCLCVTLQDCFRMPLACYL